MERRYSRSTVDEHASRAFESGGMNIRFKIPRHLARLIRDDLARPHPFAFERVGFISVSAAGGGGDLWIFAREFHPVADDDYLNDNTVGAMMGPEAIRKALQRSRVDSVGMFHVHTHCGDSIPYFSNVDLSEQARFVPNFFQMAPQCPHGALVLSNSYAYGHVWLDGQSSHKEINEFVEVGMPLKKWRTV
jgi:hypothetical protein